METQYNIQVKIFIHTDKIDFDTTEEIFKEYNTIIPYVEKDTDILFDITHGFRTMPILMYQTLQFAARKDNVFRNVELIYGEYIENEKISYVRDLSNYWYYARITDAISIFKSKLDGFDLSNLLGKEYEKYSKGDYDFWQTEGKKIRKKIISSDSKLRKQIFSLENLRNQIAHGGAKNKNTKE